MLYTDMYSSENTNLFQPLHINGLVTVHAFKVFIILPIEVDEGLDEAAELVFAVSHDHICAPDDQLWARVTITGDVTRQPRAILNVYHYVICSTVGIICTTKMATAKNICRKP